MSGLTSRIERTARRAVDASRLRRLEHGESGWGAPVQLPPVLPARTDQPRRVAVVGAGRQGQRMAVATTEVVGAELVGVADLDTDRLAGLAAAAGLTESECHTDAAAMFASTDVDLAVIATTAPSHVALGRLAKEAGIGRILLEKPIDNAHAAAAAFVAECEADGVVLGVNYSRRWLPDYRSVVAAVRAGQVGPVRIVTAQVGAGELAMLGSHYVDLCRMILDSDPVGVSAQLRPRRDPNQRGAEYEDPTGHFTVRFASGARAYIDIEDDLPRSDAVVTIRGDDGMIVLEENAELWTLRSRSGRTWTFPLAGQFRPAPIARSVVHGMLAEQAAACTGHDGLRALEVVLAALHSSADGGRSVSLPLTPDQLALETRFA